MATLSQEKDKHSTIVGSRRLIMFATRTFLSLAVLFTATACTPPTLTAQTAASTDRLSQSFDKVLSQFELQFVAVAKAMPSDKYDFTPATLGVPQGDFKGVRTFASQVKHVAEMNFVIYSVMSGLKPDMDMDSIKDLKNKDDIISALTRSFAYGHRALATLNVSNAGEMPEDSHGMTKAGIAAYVMVHDADHFGQLGEYLRMNGIIPPQSQK
jgi:hypothetical protein